MYAAGEEQWNWYVLFVLVWSTGDAVIMLCLHKINA
jgi:hypothetical protein